MKNISLIIYSVLIILSGISCKKENKTDLNPCNLSIIKWEEDIVLENDFYVDNSRLVISPGVKVSFNIGISIIVGENGYAEIHAMGTKEDPITFTSLSPVANDATRWGRILIRRSCDDSESIFEYCNFINGGRQEYESVILAKSGNLVINNCVINGSGNHGILLENNSTFSSFSNNTIKHTQGHPLAISANRIASIGNNNQLLSDSAGHGIFIYDERFYLRDTIIIKPQTLPYIISKGLDVTGDAGNSSLMLIEKGVVFSLEKDVHIKFRGEGSLKAIGSNDNPIVFTSNATVPQPGDWHSISVGLEHSILKHCVFEYGGKYEEFMASNGMVRPGSVNLSIENCIFQYSEAAGLLLYKPNVTGAQHPQLSSFSNNSFRSLESFSVSLFPQSIQSLNPQNNFNNYAIHVYGTDIHEDHILWKNVGTDYFTDSYFSILGENCATLEFEPGVVVLFNGGGIMVGSSGGWQGKIIAIGNEDNPVIFSSSKAEPQHGDWSGIKLDKYTGEGCILDNCHVLYAGNQSINSQSAAIRISNNEDHVTIKNSTIAHSSNWGIYSSNSEPNLHNNTYYDNLGGDVNVK